MSRVKFSVFADLHHHPAAFYSSAPERLAQIRRRAEANRVDFVVSLGDFCADVNDAHEVLAQFDAFPMPVFHAFGNHDTDQCTLADALRAFHLQRGHYHFDRGGFRFVVLDTNYVQIDGEFRHFELGNYYPHPNTREYLPPEQLAWLRETLCGSPCPCVLFSHASIERECNSIPGRPGRAAIVNRDEVLAVIREANAIEPGRVRLAVNGHHHRDFFRVLEEVAYLDLNSTSFDWINQPHSFYPEAITARHEFAANTVIYNEPVHAIVTIDSDGTLLIDGMRGSFFMGVTREMTDNPRFDPAARPCTPHVLSTRLKLFYGTGTGEQ